MRQVESTEALRQGRVRWPTLRLSDHAFQRYVEAHKIPTERILARASDLFLAAACAEGDRQALSAFDSAVIADTRGTVRRYGSDDFVDEVLQQLRVHLLVADDKSSPRIGRYDGRASLRSWVGICAVRMALYLLRGQRNRRELSVDLGSALFEVPTGDVVLDGLKRQYTDTFRKALGVASSGLSPRQRALLRLRFAHGATADEIATTYAVHRVTAWRWLQGAQEALLESVTQQLRIVIPDDDIGLRSLIGLVESRLELSMAGLFADDSG